METKSFYLQDLSGNVIGDAEVTVYLADTQTLATGLRDVNGAPRSNPFTTGAGGLVQFGVEDGVYDIKAVSLGRSFTLEGVTFSDIQYALAQQVWVEVGGSDSTGSVGKSGRPYATIDAALDALPSGGIIHLGFGRFAPVTDDYQGTSVPNPASKLKSNLTIIGSGIPELDNYNAPTTLQGGTIIDGHLVFHSTRHNITVACLGVDAGLAVCNSRYAGAEQDALVFANISQTVGLAPAPGVRVLDVISLNKTAASLHHGILLENLLHPLAVGLKSYYGFAGVIMKAIGGLISDVQSFGHSLAPLYLKDDNYARCYGVNASNVVVGALAAGDTPNGVYLTAGGSNDLARLSISGLKTIGVTNDLKIDALSTGITKQVSISDFHGDQPYPRVSASGADLTSVVINGKPVQGTVSLADAATINTDASRGSGAFSVTLTAAGRTLANPTNLVNGQTYLWEIVQDGAGSRTITAYGNLFTFSDGALPVQSTAPNAVDLLTAIYDGTKLRCVYSKGFA